MSSVKNLALVDSDSNDSSSDATDKHIRLNDKIMQQETKIIGLEK